MDKIGDGLVDKVSDEKDARRTVLTAEGEVAENGEGVVDISVENTEARVVEELLFSGVVDRNKIVDNRLELGVEERDNVGVDRGEGEAEEITVD